MVSNQVRIIGGLWKGRKLRFPNEEGLRPTIARTRETLFAWLMGYIDGADCLDLYAGSGALGYEAMSRGAKTVVFVEKNKHVAAALKRNNKILSAKKIEIHQKPAQLFLAKAERQWDIIFLDPPYHSQEFFASLKIIQERALLTDNGFIYFELPITAEAGFEGTWQIFRSATRGDTQFGLVVSLKSNA